MLKRMKEEGQVLLFITLWIWQNHNAVAPDEGNAIPTISQDINFCKTIIKQRA